MLAHIEEVLVDQRQFDAWIKEVASGESRRSMLAKLAKGSIGALLAGVGLVSLDEVADANHCGNRCRRIRRRNRRRACLRRCRRSHRLSTPIGVGTTPNGGACTLNRQCRSGNCQDGFCRQCGGVRLCGRSCCVVTAECVLDLCVSL
jgi:hypothetical protein